MSDEDEWKTKGACYRSEDPRFFPERGDSASHREAKAICIGQCSVRDECLEAALTGPERFGIWGGTSERERQEIRRDRNKAARLELKRAKQAP